MSFKKSSNFGLFPSGWRCLDNIENSTAKAFSKDPEHGSVKGLYYKVERLVVTPDRQVLSPPYLVTLKTWNYNIYNELNEHEVLSFLIHNRENYRQPVRKYISSIKIMAHAFPTSDLLVHRLMAATSFLMKQAENNIVPDTEQILRLHKIHPSQKRFYLGRKLQPFSILSESIRSGKEAGRKRV